MTGPAPRFDQADAAQDQRAHDPLAELGLGDQQGAQPVGRDRDRLDVGQRLRVDQRRPARQLGELAHEIAALVGDDVRRARRRSCWVTSTSPDRISIRPGPGLADRASMSPAW